MSEPFLGEIRRVSFAFAPRNWALCNGQILGIATNQALFSLLGTVYGGNGVTTFALPDLRGRSPLHPSGQIPQGAVGGAAAVTLTTPQLPMHNHIVQASSSAPGVVSPQGAYWAAPTQAAYGTDTAGVLASGAIGLTGGNGAHENQSPYLVINHIIALSGIFPSRN